MREAVRAVGRDLDVKNRVAGREHVVDRGAGGQATVEQQQAVGLVGEREFLGRTHHAGGGLAADLGLFDHKITGENRAGQGNRHTVTDVAVGCAADDGAHAAVGRADIDGAHGELVGVGVFVAGEDVADDDVVKSRCAGADDLFDLEAEEGDGARDVLGGDTGEIDVGLEPVEGNFHGRSGVRSCPRNTRNNTKVGKA